MKNHMSLEFALGVLALLFVLLFTSSSAVLAAKDPILTRLQFAASRPSLQILFSDDFSSHTPGQSPSGWLLRGTTGITPIVEEVGGSGPPYRLVSFPEVPWQYSDKWLLKDALSLSGHYRVEVKMNFQNAVADRGGLTIAWDDSTSNRIDIQPNVYTDNIEFRVSYSGPLPSNVVINNLGHVTINALTNYWLRVEAIDYGPGDGQVNVFWSTDGANFTRVIAATGLATVSGLAGMSTAGPHLPHTHFDDLTVTSLDALFLISGQVTDDDINPASGVTISDNLGHSTVTDANGDYKLMGYSAGSYTLTPSKNGYIFAPISSNISVPLHATDNNFRIRTVPTPFLDIPVNYSNFAQALQGNQGTNPGLVNSWLDHFKPNYSYDSFLWRWDGCKKNDTVNRRPGDTWYDGHSGIDFQKKLQDDPVYAAAPGVVKDVNRNWSTSTGARGSASGNYVLIDHGNGYATLYGHMRST